MEVLPKTPGDATRQSWRETPNTVSILDVPIANISRADAIDRFEQMILDDSNDGQAVYIANAHTLNLATGDPAYREVLERARLVLGDGTGVRWAAQMRGVRMLDNLVGTDLIPELFAVTAGRGYRYFLLGADTWAIARAATACRENFPGWQLAGYHQGYVGDGQIAAVISAIRRASPHVLLVGMGNPLQENWIDAHRRALNVPVSIGVGGLFDHWAGGLRRAPQWVRRHGIEWLQILLQQPSKWRRYVIGNPLFLSRVIRHAPRERPRIAER